MDPEDIKTELVNLKYRVEKVNQLKRYKTREPLNIFQIHLFPSENIKEIYNLTYLSYYFITVKPYENRISHQCFNCQMWNHGSKGCRLAPICVICAGKHPSKECPNKGKKDVEIKCANCNGPHTASYRGCPKYPKNVTKSRVQPGKSFAAAVRKTVDKSAPPPQALNDENLNFPPLSSKPDSKEKARLGNNEVMVPNQENMQLGIELITEISKIFQQFKNIPETIKQLRQTDDAYTKLMILADALR
ncbi:hypothetical protein AVEN_215421-1 [Araneus ventricosus]|uniref:Pre-C2HC domain-containing protein n=2 Tax=Araneus ventricosus TaxID=182803 RepID=A0A4Y2KB90_ARAVE|nr:hypothetical protein AVEN_215421-1 [Araneus ventricosus]